MTMISVITAVYNGADYLPDLIESLQAQTFTDYEHIIIDDGSTDDTAEVIVRYAGNDPRIRWWRRENRGQYATQNEALQTTQGKYIVVIAADDVVAEGAFTAVMAKIETQPDFIYGKTARMDEHGTPLPDIELTAPPSRWLIKQIVYAQHCSVYVRCDLIQTHDLHFDESLHYTGDWDWLIRLFAVSENIVYLRQPLASIRMHSGQTSRTATQAMINQEHRHITAKYGSSYRLHRLLTWLNNYRAMALLGFDILRKRGIGALWQRVRQRA